MIDWQIGNNILGTYEVKQVHEGGGMGLVFRVRHRGWNMDLAVKSPRPEYFVTDQQKQDFIRECQTWVNLGLHPHIVTCFYVRTLGGIPHVFMEYMEGGSLSDWIHSRKLYEHGPQDTLRRILDISIQMAWGLHYAHEQRLVHQDVKPANVLMTPEGTAKITDFGLSKALRDAAKMELKAIDKSLVVSTGGLTPAYCSPEQAKGLPLTRRTDIWSWAVSVLEMFSGNIFWRVGPAASVALAAINDIRKHITWVPAMPEGVRNVLADCLKIKEQDRPHDLVVVAERLIAIYEDLFHMPFIRALPEKQELDADSINNQIVSLMDLDIVLDLHKNNAYGSILDLREKKPDHIYGRLNDALIHWRKMGESISVLNRQVDNIYSSPFMPELTRWQVMLELQKCDTRRAFRLLEDKSYGSKAELQELTKSEHRRLKSRFMHFFQNRQCVARNLFVRDPDCRRARLLFDLSPSVRENAEVICAVANPTTGIVAICEVDSKNIIVKNIIKGTILFSIDAPHCVSHMALSENAKLLAVACSYSEKYVVSLYSVKDGQILGTHEGDKGVRSLEAVTLDDCGECVSLWLVYEIHLYQQILDLKEGKFRPFKVDYRHPSKISVADRLFVNSEHTLLLGVTKSRCSLWRFASPLGKDGVNILDINLEEYGLINTTDHLPGFELEKGFEFTIDDWNAHDLMRLLSECPPMLQVEYLLCRPPDSKTIYTKCLAKRRLLDEAEDAKNKTDKHRVIDCLNRYCDITGAYEESIMSRRHRLVKSYHTAHVDRVWHHAGFDWYWDSNSFGLSSETPDHITVRWWAKVQLCTLPDMMNEKASVEWHDPNRDQEYSVGIREIHGAKFFYYCKKITIRWKQASRCARSRKTIVELRYGVRLTGKKCFGINCKKQRITSYARLKW